jgi:hypothetical protein
MRRAVIFATLTFLLLAVAGVAIAGENTFMSSQQTGDQAESTAPEDTGSEPAAPEVTVPETVVPEATVHEDVDKPDEGTAEATIVEPEEPKAPGAGNYGGIQDDNGIDEPAAKPGKLEHAQGGNKKGMLRETGKPEHPGKPPHQRQARRRRQGWAEASRW